MSFNCPSCGAGLDVVAAGGSGGGDVGELLDRIDEGALKEGEAKFVRETRERFERYRDRIKISEKQLNWLRRLAKDSGKTQERRPPDSWSPRPDSDIPF